MNDDDLKPVGLTEITRIAGVAPSTVGVWANEGIVTPLRSNDRRQGKSVAFDAPAVFAIMLADGLRRRGVPLAGIAPLGKLVCGLTVTELNDFAARDHMLICGDGIEPRIVPINSAILNRSGGVQVVIAIDLGIAWPMTRERIRAFQKLALETTL